MGVGQESVKEKIMNSKSLTFLIAVWLISAALVYVGMEISSSAYPLFALFVPALVSFGVMNKEG